VRAGGLRHALLLVLLALARPVPRAGRAPALARLGHRARGNPARPPLSALHPGECLSGQPRRARFRRGRTGAGVGSPSPPGPWAPTCRGKAPETRAWGLKRRWWGVQWASAACVLRHRISSHPWTRRASFLYPSP